MAGSSTSSLSYNPTGVREVTEDTPPDLLEGTMDLLVILPSKKNMRMTVNRRTPVMDLLVQVTTANKINPGGHIVQVRNEIGRELQYKPSTPIGALDTRTIEIVPKHQVNDYIIVKSKQQAAKMLPQPFEHTFRLQVHLPKNQLYVMRVGPKVLLQDILEEVCQEKDLDITKYEMRHPVNLDETLSLTNRLGDYGLQQVRVVSKNSRINSSVSSADILALQDKTNGRRAGSQGCLDSAFNYSRSSVGESSVSSGSAASARGTSPSRSDESRSISPIGILPSKLKLRSSVSNASSPGNFSPLQTIMLKKSISSNPLPGSEYSKTKKKAPPPPPPDSDKLVLTRSLTTDLSEVKPQVSRHKKEVSAPIPREATTSTSATTAIGSRSRQSSASDSSGYHEASASSILSDQQQELIRKDRAIAAARKVGTGSLSSLNNPPVLSKPFGMSTESTSTTNLTSGLSISTTSIASSTGSRNKRKAPKPPVTPTLQTPLEEELPAIPGVLQPSTDALERKPVEVQVEVHSPIAAAHEHETEKERGGSDGSKIAAATSISQNQNKSSETLKYVEPSTTCSNSSTSDSTLTKSGSASGSRSSLASLPPSPLPVEENSNNHHVTSTNLDRSRSMSSSSPTTEAISSLDPAPRPVQRRRKDVIPQPKPRPRRVKQSGTEVNEPVVRGSITASSPPPVAPLPLPPVPPRVPNRNRFSNQSSTDDPQCDPPCKFGVKVLPDNCLQDLLQARLRKSAGISLTGDTSAGWAGALHEDSSKHKGRTPTPPPQSSGGAEPVKIAGTASAKGTGIASSGHHPTASNIGNNLNSLKSQAPALVPASAGIDLIHVENNEADWDDNLEENLELFEHEGDDKGVEGQVIQSGLSSGSEYDSESEEVSSESESKDDDDESDVFEDMKLVIPASGQLTSGSNATAPAPVIFASLFKRALSDSVMTGGAGLEDSISIVSVPSPKWDSKDTGRNSLNRWKNIESLELNIEEEKERKLRLENEVSVQSNIPNQTNQLSFNTELMITSTSSTNDKKLDTKVKDKISSTTAAVVASTAVSSATVPPKNRTVTSSFSPKTGSGDKHEEASSGSEASYADSGLPATATVTPSPVSLEPDVHEHHSDKSLNSSRRSSIHSSGSDHSECWRELLESKVEGQDFKISSKENMGKAQEPSGARVFSGLPVQHAESVQNINENIQTVPSSAPISPDQNHDQRNLEKLTSPSIDYCPPNASPSTGPTLALEAAPEIAPPAKLSPRNPSDSSQPSSEAEESVPKKNRDSRSGSNSSSSIQKPIKSDSFSYKGEFDIKKRRSSSTANNGVPSRRLGSKAINSYTSSSDDEDSYHEKTKHKSISMQNLSKKKHSAISAMATAPVPAEIEQAEKVVKSTSLASLPAIAIGSTEALNGLGNDSKLMETFQVELELQFEQWKEQFLQRHVLNQSKVPMEPSIEPPQKLNLTPRGTVTRKSLSSSSSEEETKFDPEIPQAVYSVGSRKGSEPDKEIQSHIDPRKASVDPPQVSPKGAAQETNLPKVDPPRSETKEPPPPSVDLPKSVPKSTESHIAPPNVDPPEVDKLPQEMQRKETIPNGVDDVKLRGKRSPAPPPVYRYSGPPAIAMGTWGERNQRSPIAVKEDNDYIMGMGQNEGKISIESKTSAVAARVHGFTGVPVVTQFPKRVQTSSSNTRWSNIEVRSPEPGASTTSSSVLSTWKQRVDETDKERSTRSNATNQADSPRSVSATSTLERPRSTLNKTSFTISSASSTLERPIGKRTPSPQFTNTASGVIAKQSAVKQASAPIAPATAALPKETIVIEESVKNSPAQAVTSNGSATADKPCKIFGTFDPCDSNTKISMEDKKRFFQGSRPELPAKEVNAPRTGIQLKTTTYTESRRAVKDPIPEDSVDAASSRSTSSCSSFGSFDAPGGMEEKKRFFQGVKPCESPTREVPVPAVNMKSSIATIQRVFEQNLKSPLVKSISSTSLASDSGSSKVTTPSPSPYGTMAKKTDTNTTIGITNQSQSDYMVSQVIKARGNFESLRRTPSPAAAAAPEPVRISTSSNIQNYGNKAVILVGSEVNDSGESNGNFYRQQLRIGGGRADGGEHSVKISINGNGVTNGVGVSKSSTVILGSKGQVNVSKQEIILEETKKPTTKSSKIQEMQSILAQQKLNFQPPAAVSPTTKIEKRPQTLEATGNAGIAAAISRRNTGSISSISSSSSEASGSAPPTPSSPLEARAGILSAIKNSGGNFGLKKTRSSVLLN